MNDNERYEKLQAQLLKEHEAICTRCGKCCGSDDGDPCLKLIQLSDGTYCCEDYQNRLGPQTTASGKQFNCILIEKALQHTRYIPPACQYLKVLKDFK